jgi:ubiquinone biosynthesis monooxygenase Coq7
MTTRNYSPLDQLVINVDQAVRTIFGKPLVTERSNPAEDIVQPKLKTEEARHSAGLMRVNHSGEVCAQALYQGQSLTAKLPDVRTNMQRAAQEENDHLEWCEGRLKELGSQPSYLNPFWYVGSFTIGATAGFIGDKWSLGFVAETERQVVRHLDKHIAQLPGKDNKSLAILEQMKTDEQNHATTALEAGAAELPDPIKKLMGLTSKLMTKTSYWI